MKKILNRIVPLALACLLVLGMAACTEDAKQGDPPVPSAEQSNPPAPSAEAEKPESSGFDFSAYPADFGAWTSAEMMNYLTDRDLLGNEDFILMELSANEVEAMKATGAFMYVDPVMGSVSDIVLYFDSANEDAKAMLDGVVQYNALVIDGNVEAGIPMDAVLGNFCFTYLNGTDDEHIGAFVQALRDLSAHYGVEPAFLQES